MKYTQEEKTKIEIIISVFEDFIKELKYLGISYIEKFEKYIWLECYDRLDSEDYYNDFEAVGINTGDQLFKKLLWEVQVQYSTPDEKEQWAHDAAESMTAFMEQILNRFPEKSRSYYEHITKTYISNAFSDCGDDNKNDTCIPKGLAVCVKRAASPLVLS